MSEDKPEGFDKYKRLGDMHWVTYEKNPYYRARVEEVIRHVLPHHWVLDLGCGDGAFMGKVASHCERVLGVDIEKSGLKIAAAKFKELRIRNAETIWSDFKDADLRVLNYLKQQGRHWGFDVVYAMDVIEHLEHPEILLTLASHAVSRQGFFLLGTPLFVEEKMVSRYHVKEYTLPELRALVATHFSIAEERILPDRLKDGRIVDRFAFLVLQRHA